MEQVKMSRAEISKKGGDAFVAKYGRARLSEISRTVDVEKRREAGRKGGSVAQARGTAHRFTSAESQALNGKGGRANFKKHGRAFYQNLGRKSAEARAAARKRLVVLPPYCGRWRIRFGHVEHMYSD